MNEQAKKKTYSIEEVMDGKKTYSLEEVMDWRNDPIVSPPKRSKAAWENDPIISPAPKARGRYVLEEDEQPMTKRYVIEDYSQTPAMRAMTQLAEETPWHQAALISTGREFDKLGKGAKDLYYRATGNQSARAKLAEDEKSNDVAFSHLAKAHPAATTVGGIAPYMVVPGGGLRYTMALGAGTGALRHGDETSAIGGALGGAAGHMLSKGLSKLISPYMNALGQTQQRIAKEARSIGAKLTPGQATGSRFLQQLEAGMQSFPVTSGAINKIKAHNQTLLNRSASKTIGESAGEVGEETIDKAFTRLSGIYKTVADKTAVNLGSFKGRLASIAADSDGVLLKPLDADPMFAKAIQHANSGQATRAELQSLASKLGQRTRSLMRSDAGDRDLGIAMLRVKEAVDDALEGSLTGTTKKLFADARGQYRNLMTLMKPGVVNEQTGNVSGRVLANTLSRTDRTFRRGANHSTTSADMRTMARFAKGFPDIVGDSGTATRLALPLLTGGIGGATISGMSGGDPAQGAKYGASTVLLPYLFSRGYTSPALTRYLQSNVLGRIPGAREAINRMGYAAPMGLLGQPSGLLDHDPE